MRMDSNVYPDPVLGGARPHSAWLASHPLPRPPLAREVRGGHYRVLPACRTCVPQGSTVASRALGDPQGMRSVLSPPLLLADTTIY